MLKKLALPIILLVALLMRVWNFTTLAIWHDEAFSALLIRMPFDEMMRRIALDVHPPFYYWLLDVWANIFGHSLASLRGFSVLFGVATVFMLYVLIKKITQSQRLSLAAAALLAVNPFHIQYSLEARMYTLGTFLVVASTWVLLKALETNKWKWWLPYALLTTASALNHYFMFFSIAAQGLFVLVWWVKNYGKDFLRLRLRQAGHAWRWLGAYVLAAVLYIPWLPTFWKQFSQVQESYWIPKMDIWSVPLTIWKILLGGFQWAPQNVLIITAIIFLALLLIYFYKYRGMNYLFIGMMAIIPFVLAILVSLKTALFLDRYFIFAAMFITTILAASLLSIRYKKIGLGLLVAMLVGSVISYADGLKTIDAKNRPGMTAASQYIFDHYPIRCPQNVASAPEKVIVSSTFIYFSYQYYYELYFDQIRGASLACEMKITPEPILYLQGITHVNQLPHFSGTALLEDHDFVGNLSAFAKKGETVMLLWTTGFGGNKPEVPSNWQEMDEQKFPDVFNHRGEIFVTKYLIK